MKVLGYEGHGPEIGHLLRSARAGRLAHAYLFCGARGCGKKTLARLLAQALFCEAEEGKRPCGFCPACKRFLSGNHPDVRALSPKGRSIGVDEVRELMDYLSRRPYEGRWHVAIVERADKMTPSAQNALLKTLEEPPAHAVFILATTEPQRLPATILSRCQRFDFRRLSVETMVERMMVVLGGIGRTASEEALHEIARAAEGAMRDALSILDVCLSYTDGEVDLALARDVLGTAGREFLFDFAAALLSGDARGALLQIDELLRRGLDPQVFAREVAEHLRALLLAQTVGEAAEELLECTPEDAQRYREQAGTAVREQLFRLMELFMRVEPDMKWAADPRALLELTAVRACCPEGEKDVSLAERVGHLEAAIERGAVAAPAREAPKAAKAPAPARERAPKAAPPPKSAAEAPPQYLQAVEALSKDNPSMRAALGGMKFAGYENSVVTAEFARPQLMFMKILERKREAMEAALTEAFAAPTKLVMRLEGEAAPQGAATQARRVIEQSYDVFGRENIDLTD